MADAKATRRRILDAATSEFAARGIAGARVDRIALAAGASKPMLYAYFGSKDQLFDAVFLDHVIANSDRVPFTAEDLPGYAQRLYDDYVNDPALLRLVAWKRLERVSAGYLFAGLEEVDAGNLRRIAEQQEAGSIRPDVDPADVWSLLIAASSTWAQLSITAVAGADDVEDDHRRRRSAVASMVRDGLAVAALPTNEKHAR
ncbi:TetR family transcriptional regulator [Microbacterium sp. P07]|uniref:TetR family transcriptional regulator n=1 Tax=Microbacterium sp. P07 TaxID=3366952 RepID=UPI0037459F5D